MTKSKRNIIIIAAVIVLLIAGILVLNFADFSSDDGEVTATSEPTYTVFSKDVSDLTNVTVTNGDTVIGAVSNNGEWTISGMDKNDVDSSKVYTLVSTVSTIISKHKIEENVTDFAQYGLENPSITVGISDKNANSDTLYIGDKSPTLGEYFIRMNNETTVYTLYSYKVDTLTKPLSYYSDFNRFSVNIDDITAIKIERENETLEMRIAEDISKTTNNVWELISPYRTTANDEYIDNNILEKLNSLTLSTLAPEGSAYGTDSPTAKVTLTVKPYDTATGKYGKEYTERFDIGRVENGKAYVSYNGKAYEVSEASVEFAKTPAFNVINKLQALVDISKVKSVEITAKSAENKIDVTHGNDDISFKLNGNDVDYKMTRSMYQAMISLAVDGIYKGETLGDSFMEFNFTGIKGEDNVKIEFKSINELSFALVRNNKAEFTIKKNKVEEFEKLWNEYLKEYGGKSNE